MVPYFEQDGIQIFLGDCRDVLPSLGRECADLIVTDPPYGVAYSTDRRNGIQRRTTTIVNDIDTAVVEQAKPLMVAALRFRRHAYLFGRWEFDDLPMTSTTELIWDKGAWTAGNLELPWALQHESITFAVKRGPKVTTDGNLAVRLRRGSILRYGRPMGTDHPTAKPVALLRELIESSSRFSELVLDPFMGCGPTLLAARLEGRRAIGIEIEERYAEIAAKRLQQTVLPLESAA